MFENLGRLFKRMVKTETKELDVSTKDSKETAKERLHMVLMQDRANVSADFLELMKEEIIDVIKKYIEVDENRIDVRLTTQTNEDGTNGTPTLYANIPILNIRNDMKVENFNFQLQSDGSIIAHKIEETDENDQNEENSNMIHEETENISIAGFTNIETETINESEKKINENFEVEKSMEEITKVEDVQEEGLNKDFEKQEISTESIKNLKKEKSRKKDRKKNKKNNKEEIKNLEEKSNIDEDDDEDDDVTFDDLLKAAEEEDRQNAEQEKKEGK